MLMRLDTQDWDPELLQLFAIPRAILPEIRASAAYFADIRNRMLGGDVERAGVPIAGVAGDQQAALFGQRAWEAGLIKATYGTGAFILQHTGSRSVASEQRLLSTVAAYASGEAPRYALEGSVFNAGSTILWLRDELALFQRSRECDRLAESVPDSAGLVIVPSFTGLGAPWWEMDARGVFVGLSRGVGRGQLCRAVLESIAQQTADVCLAMTRDSGEALTTLRVDGGVARSDLMLQYQADLLNCAIERPQVIETTALGAAFLAGLETGFWDGLDALASAWQLDRRFEPQRDDAWREAERARWLAAIETVRFDAERRRDAE